MHPELSIVVAMSILSLGSLRRGVASYKRPASNGAPIVRKRPSASGAIHSRGVAQDDLEAYAEFGRSCLAEGLGYKAIRTRLEKEHSVTAADGTMRRWLASLKRPQGAILTQLAQDDLEAYADFGRSCLAEGLGYWAIRTRLKNEHGVTVADGTIRRWLASLNRPQGAMPKKRRATMTACASKNIEELWVYDEWAQGKLSEDESLTYRGLRRLTDPHNRRH